MMALPSLLLLAGAALGPHGLAILTPSVLAFLDPAAPVGLAVFGVIAAIRMTSEGRGHELAPSAVEATFTGLLVTGALIAVPPAASGNLFAAWPVAAIVLGIAAATSDTDDAIVPIVAGALVLAATREITPAAALAFTGQSAAIAIVVAIAGWLMLVRAATTEEQRVCTFSSVLLLGGVADYLATSALLCGMVGGLSWRLAKPAMREHIRRDVTYAADSLLALVLLLAGAHADFSAAALIIGIGYTLVRASGKLAGRWTATRLLPANPLPSVRRLLAPGALGVAFALNVVRALGPEFAPVLTVVVVGTVASALMAAVWGSEAEA